MILIRFNIDIYINITVSHSADLQHNLIHVPCINTVTIAISRKYGYKRFFSMS